LTRVSKESVNPHVTTVSARRRMSSSRRVSARARVNEALERTGSNALAYARVGNADVVRDQLLDLIAVRIFLPRIRDAND